MKNVFAAAIVLCMLGWLAFAPLRAEEPKKEPPKPDPTKPEPKADEQDMYKIPEGADSTALVAFCKKLMSFKADNPVDQRAHVTKGTPLLIEACKKILALEKSDTTDNGHFAQQTSVMLSMTAFQNPKSAEFTAFVDNILKLMDSPKFDRTDAQLGMYIANKLQYVDPDKGKSLYEKLAKSLAGNKDPALKQYTAQIEGILRRLNLVGNDMELKGKTVDGKDFDLKKWKGKIVLVDFWATWCGPCRAELPNVKKNFDGYHNKGFEVVGLSGDEDRAALETFLKSDPLPWPTLHEVENGEVKENPAMAYYGITAFPTTILVGKDGKVLALNARGPKLGELLKAQLGEPEAPPEPPKVVKPDAAKPEPANPEKK